MCTRVCFALCLIAVCRAPALAADPPAGPREPLDLVPADSMLCWVGRPLPDLAPATDQPSTLQTILEVGARIAGGTIDSGTQLGARAAEMFGQLVRYPHALVLIDASAKPTVTDPEARRVDRLRFAAIVQCGEQVEPFLRIIQKAVNEQTNSGAATLTNRRAGRWTYQELSDQRLPDWAVIAWGRLGDYFVLTVGPGVWPKIAAVVMKDEPALSQDTWYAVSRAPRRRTALIEVFVAGRVILQRLDPLIAGRAGDFFRAWDAGDLEQAHWAVGFGGSALYCVAHFRRGAETVRRVYADADNRDPRLLEAIPADARYAIFDVPMGRFLPRFFGGLLSFQGPKARANIERLWAEGQARHGLDVERDLLAHLGDRVVLHNDPPHPLRLPLALTTLIEIRDEPATVSRTIEAICGAWRDALGEVAARGGAPPPFTLHRDYDDIWYLRLSLAGPDWLGLAGPAWIVTDRFIILSWSPTALRDYLERVPAEVKGRSAAARVRPTSQAVSTTREAGL